MPVRTRAMPAKVRHPPGTQEKDRATGSQSVRCVRRQRGQEIGYDEMAPPFVCLHK